MAESIAQCSSSSVVLLHGPLFMRKSDILKRVLSETHLSICPDDLFSKNPSYGLRDVALTVIQTLKKGRKVIIDSDNATASSRLSYITLIRKKLPRISISIVEILPKYGCEQLFWAREFDLAQKSSQNVENTQTRQRDYTLLKWFASEEDTDITYKKGLVEAPKEDEGAKIYKLKLGLSCETIYKLEVPGLLIQWDVLQALCKDGKLQVGAVTKVLKQWSSLCACGRIIVICDGSGVKTYSQTSEELISVMKQLTESFHDTPVYVLAVNNAGLSGGFVVPPRPGLIAYLQQRHCLDLHFKHTVYLYENQLHMKVSERAGVPHLKGSRAFEHPSLISSGHAATIPPIPAMLKTMEITQKVDEEHSGATIPMFNLIDEFTDGYLKQTTTFGRTEYLFAKDVSCIERYQALYASKATKIGEPGSKIADEIENQSAKHQQMTSQLNTSANISRRISESRDLPKWMLQRDESNTSVKSSLDMSRSDSTSSTDGKIKQTVYVMTEKELTQVAMDILKQDGKTDLLEQFQAKQRLTEANKTTCSTPHIKRNKDRNNQSDNRKTKQCNIERRNKSHSIYQSIKPTESPNTTKKLAESDSDSWYSENENDHRHHVDMETDRCVLEIDQSSDQDVNSERDRQCDNETSNNNPEETDYCVEDVVNDTLDDFLGTSRNVKRTTRLKSSPAPSPAKNCRKMVKREGKSESSTTPTKSRKEPDSLILDGETCRSQKKFNRDILGKSDTAASSVLQTVESPIQKTSNSVLHQQGKSKRQTPDLTILDELFG